MRIENDQQEVSNDGMDTTGLCKEGRVSSVRFRCGSSYIPMAISFVTWGGSALSIFAL